jgi:hypothetical protein
MIAPARVATEAVLSEELLSITITRDTKGEHLKSSTAKPIDDSSLKAVSTTVTFVVALSQRYGRVEHFRIRVRNFRSNKISERPSNPKKVINLMNCEFSNNPIEKIDVINSEM